MLSPPRRRFLFLLRLPQEEGEELDAGLDHQVSASTPTKEATTDNDTFRHSGAKRQRLLDATTLLHEVLRDKGVLDAELSAEERKAFIGATGGIFFSDPENRRRSRSVATKRAADRLLLKDTGIRRLRNQPVYVTPPPLTPLRTSPLLSTKEAGQEEQEGVPANTTTECSRKCYVCKGKYASIHHFYDQLCPDKDECAPLNFRKRSELADLSGKVSEAVLRLAKEQHPAACAKTLFALFLFVSGRYPIALTELWIFPLSRPTCFHFVCSPCKSNRKTPTNSATRPHLVTTAALDDMAACQNRSLSSPEGESRLATRPPSSCCGAAALE